MLERLFRRAGLATIERAASLEAAVATAASLAAASLAKARRGAGDGPEAVVLLSPAATSFDMFIDYEDRGRAFKAAVRGLARDAGGAA